MLSLIVRPDAEADITDAAVWYETQSPGLGLMPNTLPQPALTGVTGVVPYASMYGTASF